MRILWLPLHLEVTWDTLEGYRTVSVFRNPFPFLFLSISMRVAVVGGNVRHELVLVAAMFHPREGGGEAARARAAHVSAPPAILAISGCFAVLWASAMHHCLEQGHCGLSLPDMPSQ